MRPLISTAMNLYRFSRWELYKFAHFAITRSPTNITVPLTSTIDRKIVQGLRENGYFKTSLAELSLVSNPHLENAVPEVLKILESTPLLTQGKVYANCLSEREILDSGLLWWGIDERLLSIATHYLKHDVNFRGAFARRDGTEGGEIESRLWHRDPEDWRILKVIVYMKDVDENTGPFECIPKRFTSRLDWFPKDRKGRISTSQDLEPFKVSFTGPRGTVVFVDTCRIYHRGKINTKYPRYALFYVFHSRNPSFPELCKPLFSAKDFLEQLQLPLSTFQRSSLEYNP